jgi:hypothetical protein
VASGKAAQRFAAAEKSAPFEWIQPGAPATQNQREEKGKRERFQTKTACYL